MLSHRSPLVFVAAIFLAVFGASYVYLQLTSGVPSHVIPLTPPPGLPPLAAELKPSLIDNGDPSPAPASPVTPAEKPMDSYGDARAPDFESVAPPETRPASEVAPAKFPTPPAPPVVAERNTMAPTPSLPAPPPPSPVKVALAPSVATAPPPAARSVVAPTISSAPPPASPAKLATAPVTVPLPTPVERIVVAPPSPLPSPAKVSATPTTVAAFQSPMTVVRKVANSTIPAPAPTPPAPVKLALTPAVGSQPQPVATKIVLPRMRPSPLPSSQGIVGVTPSVTTDSPPAHAAPSPLTPLASSSSKVVTPPLAASDPSPPPPDVAAPATPPPLPPSLLPMGAEPPTADPPAGK